MRQTNETIRIPALDGGGIKGSFAEGVLTTLEERHWAAVC